MPNSAKTPQVLLGFDFGMRKIGIAVGQVITKTATPLTMIKAKDGIPSWEAIGDLIKTWQDDALVVGIPYNMDGSEQEIGFAAKRFAGRLKNHYHLPVHRVDERLTTVMAKLELQDKHGHRSAQREVDSVAASLILESWFRNH